jgi:hypothetical protein
LQNMLQEIAKRNISIWRNYVTYTSLQDWGTSTKFLRNVTLADRKGMWKVQ